MLCGDTIWRRFQTLLIFTFIICVIRLTRAFQGLRIRLTLWYCLVLCAALVIFSVILYFGARYFLLNPVEDNTAMHAHAHMQQWLRDSPYHGACPLLGSSGAPGQFGPPSGQP